MADGPGLTVSHLRRREPSPFTDERTVMDRSDRKDGDGDEEHAAWTERMQHDMAVAHDMGPDPEPPGTREEDGPPSPS